MRFLMFVTIASLLTSCADTQMNQKPNCWVKVVDRDTGQPVSDLPLAYSGVIKPYLIVGQAYISRPYVTNQDGLAHVPAGVYLTPVNQNQWVRDPAPDNHAVTRKQDPPGTIFLIARDTGSAH